MIEDFQFSSIVVSTIRNAPVLIFAAMAGLFAERSGVVDIALEGKILASAFASAAVAFVTQNPWLGILAGVGVSAVIALLQGFVSINQKGNQLVAGIALNIAIAGLTSRADAPPTWARRACSTWSCRAPRRWPGSPCWAGCTAN